MQLSSRRRADGDLETEGRRKLIGRTGPWQLVRQLSETPRSRVYQARPVDAPASVPATYAVKILRRECWNDAEAIAAMRREAWLGTQVSHPNVVPVLSSQVARPPFFIAMPCIEGTNLATRIATDGPLPLAEALWIARQVVDGLEALYQGARMVHGDVKPANILVNNTGHATLIDLEFAHTEDEALNRQAERLAGSLAYMAPELLTSSMASSLQSDLYSVGVTLYESLTGRRLFAEDDPGQLAEMLRTEKPPCIRSLLPTCPKPVASLVHSLLSKQPLRRAASHSEVAQHLVRLEIDAFSSRVA